MALLPGWRVIARMGLLIVLASVAIAVELAPTGLEAGARPSPDLLLALCIALVLRQPAATPALLVWALALCRDLIGDLPVGAGALTMLAAVEIARLWRGTLGRRSFAAEWAAATLLAFGTVAVQWLIVLATLSQPPPVLRALEQGAITALIYPAIVLFLRFVLRASWAKLEPQETSGP